ncbi:hypothetical protein FJT64_018041 [Amphibalanus amphitrite]|uniref:ATP-dependent DNA helicase n=1 Tax=Amphibalanus amphitrite TaxID=1232801 RepID=A0A6A4WYU0_AMPAM|nr:hypothetical protein FJT64_018041 [Amphibalanus amphitrite]
MDLVARVFHLKLKALLKELTTSGIFGRCVSMLMVVEFQKRGLPHGHILVIVRQEDRPRTADDDMRSIGASEACWRLFDVPMSQRQPNVVALQVHLEDHQLVYFEPGQERQAAQAARRTHLTAWLEYNRESAAADPDCRRLLYPDFPSRYTWQAGQKVWRKRRQQQAAEAIGRVVSLSPRHGDVFYLRVLLHHVAGAASFEELRTVDGVVCATYREACCLRGLLQDDREWEVTMEDAAHAQMPAQIRRLFVTLLLFCAPADPSELFRRHLDAMSDDFGRRHRDLPDELRAALTLVELERQLQQAGKELRDFGLPEVTPDQRARAAELQQAAELRQLPRLIQEELEHGTRAQVVDACLRRSALWRHFIVAPLLENMRARRAAGPDGPELRAFCDWLLELGEGRAEGPEDGFVQLPPHLVMDADIDAVIDWVFDDLAGRHGDREWMASRAVLAPRNTRVDELNAAPVARLDTGARDTVCPHCGAFLWREERATLCCSGGKAREGERPSFAQIYVNDPDCDDPAAEAALRLGHVPLPRGTREPERARLLTLLEQLQVLLRQVNPYVQDFIHAAELPEEEVQQQRLVVSADARPADQHPRRYNRAEGFREVAVLMDEEPVHQDIVLRRRADAEGPFLQTVNETHRAFEALHFVLLLPFGTDGWQPDLRQAVANGRGDVRGVSLMQYYAHRLQLRPDLDDSLFRAGRLFQEYVCMAFARVETQRLLYLARNQAGLRAELYQRLQDALPGDAERELAGGDRVGQRVILPASFTGGPRYYQRR